MAIALYRDKEGGIIHQFPFVLVIDPIMNQGRLYADADATCNGFLDDDLMDDATPENVYEMLSRRGFRVYFLRSEADLEDDLLPYFAIADGQLQEMLAACWIQQDFEFPDAEFVNWQQTTTRLYTDGERLYSEGHLIALDPALPEGATRAALESRLTTMLDAYVVQVAAELRAKVVHVAKTPS